MPQEQDGLRSGHLPEGTPQRAWHWPLQEGMGGSGGGGGALPQEGEGGWGLPSRPVSTPSRGDLASQRPPPEHCAWLSQASPPLPPASPCTSPTALGRRGPCHGGNLACSCLSVSRLLPGWAGSPWHQRCTGTLSPAPEFEGPVGTRPRRLQGFGAVAGLAEHAQELPTDCAVCR